MAAAVLRQQRTDTLRRIRAHAREASQFGSLCDAGWFRRSTCRVGCRILEGLDRVPQASHSELGSRLRGMDHNVTGSFDGFSDSRFPLLFAPNTGGLDLR